MNTHPLGHAPKKAHMGVIVSCPQTFSMVYMEWVKRTPKVIIEICGNNLRTCFYRVYECFFL